MVKNHSHTSHGLPTWTYQWPRIILIKSHGLPHQHSHLIHTINKTSLSLILDQQYHTYILKTLHIHYIFFKSNPFFCFFRNQILSFSFTYTIPINIHHLHHNNNLHQNTFTSINTTSSTFASFGVCEYHSSFIFVHTIYS